MGVVLCFDVGIVKGEDVSERVFEGAGLGMGVERVWVWVSLWVLVGVCL